MSLVIKQTIDPAVECIRYLSMYARENQGEPWSVSGAINRICEQYHLPADELEQLVKPLLALEAALAGALLPRRDLWEDFFYPGSEEENQLAWSFYMIEQQGVPLTELPECQFKQRVVADTLSLEPQMLQDVTDLDGLMAVLQTVPCELKTKWVCLNFWKEPWKYYDSYRQMVVLAETAVQGCREALQPLATIAVNHAASITEGSPSTAWENVGMDCATDSMIVCPMCIDFNGQGICWDDTMPESAAFQFVGIFKDEIQKMICTFGNRAELLSEKLKILSDQRRLEILMSLNQGPLCGTDLVEITKLSPGTVSHHMSCLAKEGLVSVSKSGTKINYSLQRQKVDELLCLMRESLLR